MPKDHTYTATVTWTGNRGEGTRRYRGYGREHDIACPGKPVLHGSADPAYRGDADRHNPEDLLVAALSACHMLWYLHLCASAGVVVTAYEDRSEGTMRTHAGRRRRVYRRHIAATRVTITARQRSRRNGRMPARTGQCHVLRRPFGQLPGRP